jgi:hypothetical protein
MRDIAVLLLGLQTVRSYRTGRMPGPLFRLLMLNPLEPDAAGRARAAFGSGLQVVCLFPAMHR